MVRSVSLEFFSLVAWVVVPSVTSLIVRTPTTQANLKQYLKSQPPSFDVVANGGWYELEKEATAKLAKKNFDELRPYLPKELDVVAAGGWNTVQSLAADPKGALLQVIENQQVKKASGGRLKRLKTKVKNLFKRKKSAAGASAVNSSHLDAIVALLQAQGKGYDSSIDGKWMLVFSRQGKKSPRLQKLVLRKDTAASPKGTSTSDFDTSKLEFYNTFDFAKGKLSSTVAYRPSADNFDIVGSDKSVVLRRILCDITNVAFKKGPLRVSFPFLKKKGGFLDVLYLDKDVRVTRGNRGGLAVHSRPGVM